MGCVCTGLVCFEPGAEECAQLLSMTITNMGSFLKIKGRNNFRGETSSRKVYPSNWGDLEPSEESEIS